MEPPQWCIPQERGVFNSISLGLARFAQNLGIQIDGETSELSHYIQYSIGALAEFCDIRNTRNQTVNIFNFNPSKGCHAVIGYRKKHFTVYLRMTQDGEYWVRYDALKSGEHRFYSYNRMLEKLNKQGDASSREIYEITHYSSEANLPEQPGAKPAAFDEAAGAAE